jgi:hypothetical protein
MLATISRTLANDTPEDRLSALSMCPRDPPSAALMPPPPTSRGWTVHPEGLRSHQAPAIRTRLTRHRCWQSNANDQVPRACASGRIRHAGGVDSEPGPPPGRRREIDTRLEAIRARLKKLRERDREAANNRSAAAGERVEAAQRHAAEAYAAAAQVLASSTEAFRKAAEAHERAASVHERAAASGIGNVRQHKRQAAHHRTAAAADRQRAERAQSFLSEPGRAGLAAVCDKPGDGVAS